MKLRILSDLHRETGPFTYEDQGEDIVILAGDIDNGVAGIEWAKTIPKPVLYVAGNHEFYGQDIDECLKSMRSAAAGGNVHFLERDSVVINGVRFIGCALWTDFGSQLVNDLNYRTAKGEENATDRLMRIALNRMNDYRMIQASGWWSETKNRESWRRFYGDQMLLNEFNAEGLLTPLGTLKIHQESVRWLRFELSKPYAGKTVVITHHAPSYRSLLDSGSVVDEYLHPKFWWMRTKDDTQIYRIAAYASQLDGLIKKYKSSIDLWVHGHIHAPLNYATGGVPVVCNPRGYHCPPLTEERAKSAAFWGYGYTQKEIEQSQEQYSLDPERGNTLGFVRSLTVDLDRALFDAMVRETERPIHALCVLQKEVRKYLAYLGSKDVHVVDLAGMHIAQQGLAFNNRVLGLMQLMADRLGIDVPLYERAVPQLAIRLGYNPVTYHSAKSVNFVVSEYFSRRKIFDRHPEPVEWGLEVLQDMKRITTALKRRMPKVLAKHTRHEP